MLWQVARIGAKCFEEFERVAHRGSLCRTPIVI
jgi:hypothetical protein